MNAPDEVMLHLGAGVFVAPAAVVAVDGSSTPPRVKISARGTWFDAPRFKSGQELADAIDAAKTAGGDQ